MSNVELPTRSPIGTFDRNQFMIVTQMDGSQKLYPRKTKSGNHLMAPLNWWKKCGIFTEERDQWMRSLNHPEHVQLMKYAGIAPSDLFGTLLSPSDTEDVLSWFNIYRAVCGRNPKTLLEFRNFMRDIDSCKAPETDPLKLGSYVQALRGTKIPLSAFTFAAGNAGWTEAIAQHLAGVRQPVYLASPVRALMQLGGTPDAIDILVAPKKTNSDSYGSRVTEALGAMFGAGEFTPTTECYAEVRLLADTFDAAPQVREVVKRIFFTEGTDRQRLHDVVVVNHVTTELQINAIFTEEVPTALVGGFL